MREEHRKAPVACRANPGAGMEDGYARGVVARYAAQQPAELISVERRDAYFGDLADELGAVHRPNYLVDRLAPFLQIELQLLARRVELLPQRALQRRRLQP